VQAGRYAAGLDPLTFAGGPSSASALVAVKLAPIGPLPLIARQLSANNLTLSQGQSGVIAVNLQAQGNENAAGFTVLFDPASLSYVSAAPGSAAGGATLNVNADQAAFGKLGFALALPIGKSLPPGLDQLVQITFRASTTASGGITVGFGDGPVDREVSDSNANALTTDYLNGSVTVNQSPSLRISLSGQNIVLAWPSWATNFVLQQAQGVLSASTAWTSLPAAGNVVGNERVLTLPMSGTATYYRLQMR
jgi:hypothetical protein